MILKGRSNALSGENYRFGFQDQETDDEFWGGAVAFAYRIEDARLGRFFSVDPLTKNYANNSPYAFSENRPIDCIELEGLESRKNRYSWWHNLFNYFGWGDPKKRHSGDPIKENKLNTQTEALNDLTDDINELYETQKMMFSLFPGMSSYYSIMEGKEGEAAIYGGFDLFGGSLVAGVFEIGYKVTAKIIAREVSSTAYSAIGKGCADALEADISLKNSFKDGAYTIMEATEDFLVYRFSGGTAKSKGGSFFSLTMASNTQEADILLNIWKWENTGQEMTPVLIKKGTQFAFGDVAGGEGAQIYIQYELQNINILERFTNQTIKLSGPLPLQTDDSQLVKGVLLFPPKN